MEANVTETGSTVPRRQLGRYLREAREKAMINVTQTAKHMQWSRDRVYRVEAGRVQVRRHEVDAMLTLYQVPQPLKDVYLNLATATAQKGWWQAHGQVVPEWFDLYLGLEAAASRLCWYEGTIIPGILQTPGYTEAICRVDTRLDQEAIDLTVKQRAQRQLLLARVEPPAPQLEVVLAESVLRQPVSDRAAMREQLTHLIRVQAERNVRIRVVPASAGPNMATFVGSFVILEFEPRENQPAEPTTVYLESLTGALYLDKPAEVEAFQFAWKTGVASSLGVKASRDLISAILKET